MRIKDFFIAGLIVIVIIICWIVLDEKRKNRLKDKVIERLTDENEELKKGYLDLFQQYLLLEENTPNEIVAELEKLKMQADSLGKDAHIELSSVIENVRNGKGEKAVRELGKIIEQALKKKAEGDAGFKNKATLCNLLDYAKNCNWINPLEHANAHLIREIRNRESHELNVKEPGHKIGLAIFAGIEILYTLYPPSKIA